MQAIYRRNYGSPDTLALVDVEKPSPKVNEVVIRVHAAGLHVGDAFAVRGSPFLMRMETGWTRPKRGIPGFDVAGTVETVGKEVTQWKPGDAVLGECRGSCAQYVTASEDRLARKPSCLTFAQAAVVPTSGLAALHALRDVARVASGQRVLINGASGGVGTFAIQIAKAWGAEVTGVCSDRNVDMVRSIGADHVIAYDREDFTTGDGRYDVIFDNVENRSLQECRRVLGPSGTLILNSGTGASGIALLWRLIKPLLISPFTRQNLRRYLSVPNRKDLELLATLIKDGCLTPVVDRSFSLAETPDAIRYLETGRVKGKVVVLVEEFMPPVSTDETTH
ncbi:Phthiocerol synthesis polyketide synthase type I PpsC [Planctomycetes bacterium CA13]|uniref:Phthiocerol synthesis polyketide synthase type I PpsC n=1 Tax=Novipirellula herctigrandis TaxID=2527986 RepID=A0A5C5Z062_9BACT|nr:Phthiocerol synthesis polyketide synthase type I PpsC [Planctomycetes bacterium CA13]